MNRKWTLFSSSWLATSLIWGVAQANPPIQDIDIIACNNQNPTTYAIKPGDTVNEAIHVLNATGTVNWEINGTDTGCTATGDGNISCINGKITVALPKGAVSNLTPVPITGTGFTSADLGAVGPFSLLVSQAPSANPQCVAHYQLRVTANGGGWGDPHMTTVDGVHYDFQGAGEFTSLREDKFELQTRQTPVPTTAVPGPNAYTGLASCVSVYSAVALRIGSNRVTLEPNISGQPDPSGLQLRVNGELTTIPEGGIDLVSGGGGGPITLKNRDEEGPQLEGRIVNAATGGGAVEITNVLGTRVVVTPAYWPDQQTWYLNVNAYDTTATQGILGRLANGSWLPALPDGTSLGPQPESLADRYQALYGKFGNAWRVTDYTTLFDYSPGTSTATFTNAGWPRFNPESCLLEGHTPAQPVDLPVAQQACSAITDKTQQNDCIFDVSVTGNTDFAKSYGVMQQLVPGATTVTVTDNKNPTRKEEHVRFTATVAEAAPRGQGTPTGTVQFTVDGYKVGHPLKLDAKGQASFTTDDLRVGVHKIIARYVPAKRIVFLGSTSAPETHTVIRCYDRDHGHYRDHDSDHSDRDGHCGRDRD